MIECENTFFTRIMHHEKEIFYSHDRSIVLYNALLYSFTHPDADCMVMKQGRIIWLGDQRVARNLYADAQWIDMDGKWIAPLFINIYSDPCVEDIPQSCTGYSTLVRSGFLSRQLPRQYFLFTEDTVISEITNSLQLAVTNSIPVSLRVSHPALMQRAYMVLHQLRQQYSLSEIISAGTCIEYTFPLDDNQMEQIAALGIPVCIVVQEIISHFTHQAPQNLPLLAQAGIITAVGFTRTADFSCASPWYDLSLLVKESNYFLPLSYRYVFQAATRGGYRMVDREDYITYGITVGAVADYGIWEVADFLQADASASAIHKWSLDPRSRIPVLPDFTISYPQLWGECIAESLFPQQIGQQ